MPGSTHRRTFRSSRHRPTLLLVGTLLSAQLLPAQPAQSTPDASAPGCVLQKDVYRCNLQAFRSQLAASHTVILETAPMDRLAAAQLRHLTESLGKTIAPADHPEQPADLTFLLVPLQPDAIYMGPADRPLATLRVYLAGPAATSGTTQNDRRGTLLWAEVLRGQPDQPWPVTVRRLLEQFQTSLAQPAH